MKIIGKTYCNEGWPVQYIILLCVHVVENEEKTKTDDRGPNTPLRLLKTSHVLFSKTILMSRTRGTW